MTSLWESISRKQPHGVMHLPGLVLTVIQVIKGLLVVAEQRGAEVVAAVFHRDSSWRKGGRVD